MRQATAIRLIGLLTALLLGGCSSDDGASEAQHDPNPTSTEAPATTTTTTATTTQTPPSTTQETPTTVPPNTLETLLRPLMQPWEWRSGLWTIHGSGYPAEFTVSYDGDHMFTIFNVGESKPLPVSGEASLIEEEIRDRCAGRMGEIRVNDVESVGFLGREAVLSTCVAPGEGPAESVFLELYFHKADETWIQLWASEAEWDTIDPRPIAAFAPAFRQFVDAHADGPVPAFEPLGPPDRYDILFQNPPGSFCRDIEGRGFSYRHAVAYWLHEGMPDRMDADQNGVPCETVYPAFAVEMVYGDPTWSAVEIITTTIDDGVRRFIATGPAADAGVVCPSGTVEVIDEGEWGWADEYICDDGTGTFTVTVDDHMHGEDVVFATWSIGQLGSGAYEWLDAGGAGIANITPDGLREPHLSGRAAINPRG